MSSRLMPNTPRPACWISALLFCLPSTASLAAEEAAAAKPAGPPVTVTQGIVKSVVEWNEYTGRFQAAEEVDIRARVSGYLQSVHFEEGQKVKAGDLLFRIDPRPYEAAVARAQADLARAKSQLTLAQLDLHRGERLLKQNAIAQEEVDTRRARQEGAEADVQAAQAQLRTAQLDLDYAQIRSPIDGRISSRNIDVGNLVVANSDGEPMTTIVSGQPILFVFDVPENDYLKYVRQRGARQGKGPTDRITRVDLRLLDEQTWNHKGMVDFVDNRFNDQTGTLRLRAQFDNADNLLLPGLFGRIRLPVTEAKPTLLIPDKAVIADQANKLVMTVNADNTVVPKRVELGPLQDGLRVVRSGLTAEDRFIVRGLMRARPGSPVTPQAVPLDQLDAPQQTDSKQKGKPQ